MNFKNVVKPLYYTIIKFTSSNDPGGALNVLLCACGQILRKLRKWPSLVLNAGQIDFKAALSVLRVAFLGRLMSKNERLALSSNELVAVLSFCIMNRSLSKQNYSGATKETK